MSRTAQPARTRSAAARVATAAAVLTALALSSAACVGGDQPTPGGDTGTPLPVPSTAPATAGATATASNSPTPLASEASGLVGSGCGSLTSTADQLASEPLADALTQIPQLSQLASAVRTAGVESQLNQTGGVTVFAPSDAAFAALPATTRDQLLNGPATARVEQLEYHVVRGRLSPQQVAGTHVTLDSGHSITVVRQGSQYLVNGDVPVVCGGISTQNATVYVIGQVLTPPA